MSENRYRDRTLVLRVLVPSLEARLREKMKEANDVAASRSTTPKPTLSPAATNEPKDILMDLDGVSCEPTKDGSTLWNFRCDGATYPARLVNLPCPVEIHKTHDHAMYYKCVDVAQMLIVYEDKMALDEAEAAPKSEGYPSYHHSGLTPPLKDVVKNRFEKREHKAVAPPKLEVSHVEGDLIDLMERLSAKDSRKKSKAPAAVTATKVLEDVVDDIVDYEPWMDDHGRQPQGVEFDDKEASKHPELWLDPDEIDEIKQEEAKKKKASAKKEAAKKESSKKKAKKKAEEAAGSSTKKGIASKKTVEQVDDVTQAATQMNVDMEDIDNILAGDVLDGYFSFEENDNALEGLQDLGF